MKRVKKWDMKAGNTTELEILSCSSLLLIRSHWLDVSLMNVKVILKSIPENNKSNIFFRELKRLFSQKQRHLRCQNVDHPKLENIKNIPFTARNKKKNVNYDYFSITPYQPTEDNRKNCCKGRNKTIICRKLTKYKNPQNLRNKSNQGTKI